MHYYGSFALNFFDGICPEFIGHKKSPCVCRGFDMVFRSLGFDRYNRYIRPVVLFLCEFHDTVNLGVQCVVFTHIHILPRVMLCSSLTNNDVAR